MGSTSREVGGETTAKLSELEQATLTALRKRREAGEGLRGLRCGTAVCEQLTDLASHDLVDIQRMERDGNVWNVDVALT